MCSIYGSSKSLHFFKDLEEIVGEEELKRLKENVNSKEDKKEMAKTTGSIIEIENNHIKANEYSNSRAKAGELWTYKIPLNPKELLGLVVAVNDDVITLLKLVDEKNKNNDITIKKAGIKYCSSYMMQFSFDNCLIAYQGELNSEDFENIMKSVASSLDIKSYIGKGDDDLLAEVIAKDEEIKALKNNLEECEKELAEIKTKKVSTKSVASSTDKAKDKEIESLKLDNFTLQNTVYELSEQLKGASSKETEIISRDKELVAKDKELISKDKELIEKDKELVEKDKQLVRIEAQLEIYKDLYEKYEKLLVDVKSKQ